MKQLILTLISIVAGFATAFGVPANSRPQDVRLPDGTALAVRLCGDESHRFFTTTDGYLISRSTDGFYYYLDENLIVTSRKASNISVRDTSERAFLSSINKDVSRAKMAQRSSMSKQKQQSSGLLTTFPTEGEVRGAVILVQYTDVSFSIPNANEEFSALLNQEGYSKFDGTGSARDWFLDQSSSAFNPHFDVYGPVTLPHPRAYYGENVGADDARAHEMLPHACDILDSEVDFSQYDADGDGWVDNVFLFYAGVGENLGVSAPADAVWPHSWDLIEATSEPFIYDGVRLNHYACSNEIDLEGRMDGIGTFVHEFSHVLGLPDMYATNGSSAFTPGEWDVMDGGSYNNNSRTPPNMTAYERYALDWLQPRKLTKAANIKLDDIAANTAAMIQTANENEYFLFENRQQKGWDRYVPGHGMLVWHVDYNANVWKYNTVNNRRDHQYVDIEEADQTENSGNRDGDCFPGTAFVTEFTDDTTPSMRSWDDTPQNMPITEIRESNGYIYFKVCGGRDEVDPVEAYEATEVGVDCFTASWSEANSGCRYILSVYTIDESVPGKPVTTYVPGWEARDLGAALSVVVSDLQPSTTYRYSVRVLDQELGMQSVGSNEITVTTLDATFDYLQPEITSIVQKNDSFEIAWNPVEDAEEYIVSVYTKNVGDGEKSLADFTGGVSAMQPGWESNSNLTYANAAYCGEAVPSLRFNADAQYLQTPVYADDIASISFWARGVSADPDARIEIYLRGKADWQLIGSLEVENGVGGRLYTCAEDETWNENCRQMKIVFRNGGKGSLALDDVKVIHGIYTDKVYVGGDESYWSGTWLSTTIEGLQAGTKYWTRVRARNGELFSKYSEERRLWFGSSSVLAIDRENANVKISGLNVTADVPLALYNMQGICVAKGEQSVTAPSAGIYLLRVGGEALKVVLK